MRFKKKERFFIVLTCLSNVWNEKGLRLDFPSRSYESICCTHLIGEMFTKNRHVLQKQHIFSKNAAQKSSDSVCDCISITKLLYADRSGAHGTRKVTITSQFVTIDFYDCIMF